MNAGAAAFKGLHDKSHPLVLPNAWDAASARIIEGAGFDAIATTSAGVAWSLGYRDGERAPIEEMVAVAGRIARVVRVPVSADFEAGYSANIDGLLKNVEAVVKAGAVGINLEDWNPAAEDYFSIDVACARITAVKGRFADSLFVNARTDQYLHPGEPKQQYEHAVRRLQAYVDAGADGVFAPGVLDDDTVAGVANSVPAPLNVLGNKPAYTVTHLQSLGVARISLGARVTLWVMGKVKALARDLRDSGAFEFLGDRTLMTHADADA